MTQTEVESFLTIVETGSLSKAADTLYVSQSTLSGRLHSLESELGTTLIVRKQGIRTIQLTDSGKVFLPIAEKWMQLWQETHDAIAQKKRKTIRICAGHSINTYILPEVCMRFTQTNPEISLQTRSWHSTEVYRHMEAGLADIGFVNTIQYSKKLITTPLFSEKMVLVCNPKSSFPDMVHPENLRSENEILLFGMQTALEWHNYWFGPDAPVRIRTDDISCIETFLTSQDCWSILPLSAAGALANRKSARICALSQPPAKRTVYLLSHQKPSTDSKLQLFVKTFEEVVQAKSSL